jgi:hypothetical protein
MRLIGRMINNMFYDSEEDLINEGILNKLGEADKLLGYSHNPCINCNRIRVEEYTSGKLVCEKCDTDQDTGKIVEDKYYSNY